MTDNLIAQAEAALKLATKGKAVQYSPQYCEEAKGAPCTEWDSSHDLSVIRPDGTRYRIGTFRHADDAAFDQWCRAGVPALIARIRELEGGTDARLRAATLALARADEKRDAAEAKLAEVEKERDGLRRRLQAMHRRAQKSEGRMARTRYILKAVRGYLKARNGKFSWHSTFHMIGAAMEHARRGSGRAISADCHWYLAEKDAAEATVATLTAQVEAMRDALDNLLESITASDQIGDRSLTITGPTANLKWLIEACDAARAALTTENQTNG